MDVTTSPGEESTETEAERAREIPERLLLAAVHLLRAEATLALIRTRQLALHALVTLAMVIAAGLLAQVAVALLVLGPLLQAQLSRWTMGWLLSVPLLLAILMGLLAFRRVKSLLREANSDDGCARTTPDVDTLGETEPRRPSSKHEFQ